MRKINYIDLFAGCGGISEGLEQSKKFNHVASVEWDKHCCNTIRNRLATKWRYNNVQDSVIEYDIQETSKIINGIKNKKEFFPGLKKLSESKTIDLIIGGPPCQAYSIAGRIRDKDGMKNDYRNYLFESFTKIVSTLKPKIFIIENVPGMLSAKPGDILVTDRIKAAFNEINYSIPDDFKECVFDLSQFGIPQKRKRVFIFGISNKVKNKEIVLTKFYDLIKEKKTTKITTVKEAIGDLGKLLPLNNVDYKKGKKYSHNFTSKDETNDHIPRFHNKRDIKIFSMLTKDIEKGEMRYTKTRELHKLYEKIVGKTSSVHKYYVLRKNDVSNLIPAHLYKDGLRHIHYDSKQARSITPREAARLQTFDDNFKFIGPMTEQFKMIGNAVPPKFALIIAKTLLDLKIF